jgi:hypothetical protein
VVVYFADVTTIRFEGGTTSLFVSRMQQAGRRLTRAAAILRADSV